MSNMIFTSDPIIKDIRWRKLADIIVDKYGIINSYVELFIICASIGISDGQKEDSLISDDDSFTPINLPRNVLSRQEHNDNLDFLYQSLVFSFETTLSTEEKINLAFRDDETTGTKKFEQLRLCANYGMRILSEAIEGYEDEYMIMEEVLSLLKNKVLDKETFMKLFLEEELEG